MRLLPALVLIHSVALTGCATKTQWVRSDKMVKASGNQGRREATTHDLARLLGIYEQVFPLKEPPTGRGWRARVFFEKIGAPAKHLGSTVTGQSVPILVATQRDGGEEQAWTTLSLASGEAPIAKGRYTPPDALYDYHYHPGQDLGAGRWVIRIWTDNPNTLPDLGDLTFKARLILEVVEI